MDYQQQLQKAFPGAALSFKAYLGQDEITTEPNLIPALIQYLKQILDFDFLVDITAVDYSTRAARFDLIYILYSFSRNERIRIRAESSEQALSVTAIFAGSNWLEREIFDMFGIRFEGHPNLKRILLPEDWQGHPLRKEYPIAQPDEAWVAANMDLL